MRVSPFRQSYYSLDVFVKASFRFSVRSFIRTPCARFHSQGSYSKASNYRMDYDTGCQSYFRWVDRYTKSELEFKQYSFNHGIQGLQDQVLIDFPLSRFTNMLHSPSCFHLG
jgi:hypothetical protein